MPDAHPNPVTAEALKLPIFEYLQGKRLILASSSPNRKEALERMGLRPEIKKPAFAEDLPKDRFKGRLHEYPVATAREKAVEVFTRAQTDFEKTPPPDMVISGDTVVIFPVVSNGSPDRDEPQIYEKPDGKQEQLEWLLKMNGKTVEIVTGVTVAVPQAKSPGYKIHKLSCTSTLKLFDNRRDVLVAYVNSGQGSNKCGGFGVGGLGAILVESTSGDYHNGVGFPTSQVWRWLNDLVKEGVLL